jgi:hypothetical protein
MKTSTDSVSLPTEEQVVSFFRAKLQAFQTTLPGYSTLKLEFGIYTSGVEAVEWGVYHEDNGCSPDTAKASLESAIRWHFSTEVVARKIQKLREEAAEKLRQADQLEHATT